MTPEEIRELHASGELRLGDVVDPAYELDEDDMHDDMFEEGDDFHDDEGEEDEDDEEDDDFHDAEESVFEYVLGIESADDDADNAHPTEASDLADDERTAIQQRLISLIATHRPGLLSRQQVLEYLRRSNLGHVLRSDIDDDDDEDDDEFAWGARRRRQTPDPNRFPKVPSERGTELMHSGTFGASEVGSTIRSKKCVARRLLDRELGLGDVAHRRVNQGKMTQSMLPTTDADMIVHYDEPVYSGQFSDDGNFFYACVKDFRVRMYDTSNPYQWRHYKTVEYPAGGAWTLTDATLSPDNRWLAYTSITHNVGLAPTDPNDTGDPYMLNLRDRDTAQAGWYGRMGIFSIRFSGDGRELVAGTNQNSLVVYDIESRKVLHSVKGHANHVNAVCFADKSSPHILYSGSDDATIKVWDRRSMGDGRPAGAFVGHIEGLTYIDSKGDGQYILSNGKDQSMKLWDLKMMYTTARYEELQPRQHTAHSAFDYRWGDYDESSWFPHPNDNSVVTFRGHSVLHTLIRCHFSPPSSTDARYVYTGSHDGKVWIYNMDATVAGTIDVEAATRRRPSALPPRYRALHARRGFGGWSTCVRDASWHPTAPCLAASSLNGWEQAVGTVTLHGYHEAGASDEGESPRMGCGYDDRLQLVGENTGDLAGAGDLSAGEDDEDEEDALDAWRGWAI